MKRLSLISAILISASLIGATASGQEVDTQPWSFRPLTAPAIPKVRDSAWPHQELDRFILARLEAAGLTPNAGADRPTLIRRASFDLTGLPPTPADIDAFVRDPAADGIAFVRVIDHYLKSPRFGERWGRHWLDVARYADSVGRSWNAPFNYAWRYRNYVIDAFNEDKPYDRFVLEQLAGDLLPSPKDAQLVATGFLALGSVSIQEGRREPFLLDRVDDQIDVTSRAFLGLTWSCARCHDHKVDPVAIDDYYALAGIFYSTQTLSGQGIRSEGNLNYVDGKSLVRLPSMPEPSWDGIHTMADFQEELRSGNKNIRYTFSKSLAMGVKEGEVRDCAVRIKGDPYEPDKTPARGSIKIPGLPKISKIAENASGRLELARWIASDTHPLTARVLVNRVWQHLFGRGIVRTSDDFGNSGEEPTHPELLDHLATRFTQNGWSIKQLIRTIMLSRTYRLSSAGQKEAREKDPQNDLYWRMNLRRLELEPLRDSMLLVADRLTFERPDGIQVTGTGGKTRAATSSLLTMSAPYRTVYLPVLRSLLPELYGTFDFPDPCQITGQREVTTVATQALYFLNNDFVVDCARRTAEALSADTKLSDTLRVQQAYRRILGRLATTEEQGEAVGLIQDASWPTFVQALLASGEFRYVR